MNDREYRPWLIHRLEIIENYWVLYCITEKDDLFTVRVHKSVCSAKWLSEIIRKSPYDWLDKSELRDIDIPVEAIISVWKAPDETTGKEEFEGFRINGEVYTFELSYSIFK